MFFDINTQNGVPVYEQVFRQIAFAVANGGIETHPDYEREKLNLATMKPNIAWIDRRTGEVLGRRELVQVSVDAAAAACCGCREPALGVAARCAGPCRWRQPVDRCRSAR